MLATDEVLQKGSTGLSGQRLILCSCVPVE